MRKSFLDCIIKIISKLICHIRDRIKNNRRIWDGKGGVRRSLCVVLNRFLSSSSDRMHYEIIIKLIAVACKWRSKRVEVISERTIKYRGICEQHV